MKISSVSLSADVRRSFDGAASVCPGHMEEDEDTDMATSGTSKQVTGEGAVEVEEEVDAPGDELAGQEMVDVIAARMCFREICHVSNTSTLRPNSPRKLKVHCRDSVE